MLVIQPLHAHLVINLNNNHDDIGLHHLHAELCGSNYKSAAYNHFEKISQFLDKVNEKFLSNSHEKCIYCDAVDTLSDITFWINPKYPLSTNTISSANKIIYISYVTTNSYITQLQRAPPITS